MIELPVLGTIAQYRRVGDSTQFAGNMIFALALTGLMVMFGAVLYIDLAAGGLRSLI